MKVNPPDACAIILKSWAVTKVRRSIRMISASPSRSKIIRSTTATSKELFQRANTAVARSSSGIAAIGRRRSRGRA